jgi:hypothetical protein
VIINVGTTINNIYTSGITLAAIYTTITETGSVGNTAANGSAVFGPGGTAWTLVNSGLISETYYGIGVSLAQSGIITNASGGVINAYDGVVAGDVATVVNAGQITANDTMSGAIGINLSAGGTVTNQAGGTIVGYTGIQISGASGTVLNLGRIVSDHNSYGNDGIYLQSGGEVTNGAAGGTASTAFITAYGVGVKFGAAGTGTLVNYGTIFYGQGAPAIELTNGLVINGPNGATGAQIIAGNADAVLIHGSGTVVNYGTIKNTNGGGASYGISLSGGGTISNLGETALISGTDGVYAEGNATVVNGGTIASAPDSSYTSDIAVKFGAGTNLMIVDPGAVFIGSVAGAGAGSTLEFASAGTTGTISGLGTQYTNFPQISVDSGAQWMISGYNLIAGGYTMTNAGTLFDSGTLTNAGSVDGSGKIEIGLGVTLIDTGVIAAGQTVGFTGTSGMLDLVPSGFYATIGNFQAGDAIALTGVSDITTYDVVNGNTLDLTRSGGSHIDLTLDRNYTTADFATTVDGANTDITTTTVTCFAAGTALDTPDGPVAVETLRAGDLVLTAAGQVRPIRWIGRRRLDITRHPDPRKVRPIRILANALADGSPRRDLLVSPDHALLLDGMLIPARLLRNAATIRREERCSVVTYYHVELDTHDVVLAEGTAAESYLDTGNRDSFENADLPTRLHPDLEGGQLRRERESCAPFVADAVRTEPVWRRLAQRAVQLGQTPPEPLSADTDPTLHVVCDGRSFAPIAVEGTRHTFLLPAWQGTLRLRSGCGIPNEVTPWIEDQRRLGVMIQHLTLTTASYTRTIPVDHPALGAGWWDVERDAGAMWRWTDGDAAIEIASAGPCRLEIEVVGRVTSTRSPTVAFSTLAAA